MINKSALENKSESYEKIGFSDYLKFILPSVIGVLLFMIPISFAGDFTIPIAIFSNALKGMISDYLPMITTVLIIISFIFTVIVKLRKPSKSNYFVNLFNASGIWLVCRVLGAIFALLTLLGVGSEMVYS